MKEQQKKNKKYLGRECGLIVDGYPRNGGQIVKCFLEDNGININKFDYHSKGTTDTRLRRGKRKIDGTTVSVPADITNEQLKEFLIKDISSGLYTVGELIVPQKFTKLKIDDRNNIVPEEFEISGRKISLLDIRKKHYEKNK